jgi:hypothetical protein
MLRTLNAAMVQAVGETLGRFFEDKMIDMIKRWRAEGPKETKRTIVYFVSSLRFLQARKLLDESNINFLELGDDANEVDGKWMRKYFKADENVVPLMTERFYFHYRLSMGAVGRVVFMQPPTFPLSPASSPGPPPLSCILQSLTRWRSRESWDPGLFRG